MKVLHLPTSVGGNSWGLAQAEKSIGLDSRVLIDNNTWLNYKNDICLNLQDKNTFSAVLKRIQTFFQIRTKYDVFHFNYGTSLLDFVYRAIFVLDLPFYKGKKIMTYNGSDARQNLNILCGKFIGEIYEIEPYNNVDRNNKIKKRIEKVTKHVDHIFSLNPDLMYFLPPEKTTFLPYTIAGWNDIDELPFQIEQKIKIVHSPTNRAFKGSKYILEALERLQQKYDHIEVTIVEGIPYDKALKLYQEAHIVIDQILIGWYGAFAVEVMKMGKPLAVFIRKEDLHFIPDQMANDLLETIINIDQNNIESTIEHYINNTDKLYVKSKQSIDYVQKWHDPVKIATIVKDVYES